MIVNLFNRRALKLCVFGVILFQWQYAWCYDPQTHAYLTGAAVKRSVLVTDPMFFTKLGLSSNQLFPTFAGVDVVAPRPGQDQPPEFGARWGAIFEDEQYSAVALNHFFDPQNDGRGLTILGMEPGHPSPDWVLSPDPAWLQQNWSFPKAHAQLFLALTAAQPSERLNSFGRVFQSLGHMVHHIQDMAQPQHVRNEMHLDKGVPMAAAAYEGKAKDILTESAIAQYIASRPILIPSLQSAREYWQVPGVYDKYTGMADFTSKNFVSYNSGYRYNKDDGSIGPAEGFPLPNGYNYSDTSLKSRVLEGVSIPLAIGGGNVSGVMGFVKGGFYDTYAGSPTSDNNQYLGYASASNIYGGNYEIYNWNHPKVWDSGWKFLVPRAVAFSAGLINHFFKGQVDFSNVGGDNWQIKNTSTLATSGSYRVLSENSSGVRSIIAEYPLSLAPGASANVSFSRAADARKLVIAFGGALGGEAGTAHGRVVELPKYNSSTQLSVSANPVIQGNPVNLTANVSGAASIAGTVQFKRNGVNIGAPISVSAGKANFSDMVGLGVYNYSADYSGDDQNASSSGAITVTIREPIAWCKPASTFTSKQGNVFYHTNVWDLGTEPGAVKVVMEPGGNSQSWTLLNSAGKVIFSSSFTYRTEHNFSYERNNFGGRNLTIKAEGTAMPLNGGEAGFMVSVSCPGGGNVLPKKSVLFYTKGNTCNAGWYIAIDGVKKNVNAVYDLTPGVTHRVTDWGWQAGITGCGGSSQTSPGGVYYTDKTGEHQLPTNPGGSVFVINN